MEEGQEKEGAKMLLLQFCLTPCAPLKNRDLPASPGIGLNAASSAPLPQDRITLPTAPTPRPDEIHLVGFFPVVFLVGVSVVAVLVFLAEVGLGAQRREGEQAGAGAHGGQGGGLQAHGERGEGQGQRLQLRKLVGLELLL